MLTRSISPRTAVLLTLAIVVGGSVALGAYDLNQRQKAQQQAHDRLPIATRPYDVNKDGVLSGQEIFNLLRDYQPKREAVEYRTNR